MNEYRDYIEPGRRVELIVRTTNSTIRFYCAFDRFEENSIFVGKPQNKHVQFNFPLGQMLDLYAYTRGGVFRLRCRLKSYNGEKCELSLPISVDKIQRREFIRVNIKTDVIIKPRPSTRIITIRTKTKNISAKGLNVVLDQDISNFANVDLEIIFPDRVIKTVAKIIKVKPIDIESRTYYSTSLMFLSITDKEINFIVKKCFEYEAAQRRKMLEIEY